MVYGIQDKNKFLALLDNVNIVQKKGTKKYYYNVAMSFDIETSSFYVNENNDSVSVETENKCSNMYIWQFAINDNIIYGRLWIEFIDLIKSIVIKLQTNENVRCIIYVHNLSYEFQYIFKFFKWLDVFAICERKPIYAVTLDGIEFRCSYILSGYNLDTLAKNLENKTVKKMVGNLDYNLIRHSDTPLTDKELEYCFNDVLIVTEYVNEQIKEYGTIANIPYTQTGVVRRYVKKNCFENKQYKYFIKELTLTELEFEKLRLCYSGGFTHSNAIHTNEVIENVSSYDFTSSYPYVMLSEKYPMSKGKQIKITDKKQFEELLVNYCCLFTIHIENVKPKTYNENILQLSKAYNIKNQKINNGRIISCDSCDIVVNEIDYKNLCLFYTFEHLRVSNFFIYQKDYLPREIIESVLTLYKNKTELKGVPGKEKEYLHSKEMINSIYGMCVTNTMKEDIIFNGLEWSVDLNYNLNEKLDNYNNDRNRFLFYAWGVWITSYARNNLFNGILSVGNDYIYSDTDSIKLMNRENHLNYFENYNKQVETKLKNMCKHYNIDFNLCKPKTIKGIEKLIGVWDYEGTYDRFKTLGAKRYMTEKNGNYEITIAGLSKKSVNYMIEKSKELNIDIFDFFKDYMYIPKDKTGKNTHTYIDIEKRVNVIDYMGNVKNVICKSGVHLTPSDFTLNMGLLYLDYLMNIDKIINYK